MSAEITAQQHDNVKAIAKKNVNEIEEDDVIELEASRRKINEMSELLENVGSASGEMSRMHLVDRLVLILTRDEANEEFANEYEMQPRIGNELTLDMLETLLPRFTGDNIVNAGQWMDNFEELAGRCEWSDTQKILYCRSLLRGSAQLFVQMVRCLTWAQLKAALLTEFAEPSNQATVRNILMNRAKNSNETPRQYFYKMLHIAGQANINTRDLIKYIADGIQDIEENKTVIRQARSIPDLKRKLISYQTISEGPQTKKPVLSSEKNCDRGGAVGN